MGVAHDLNNVALNGIALKPIALQNIAHGVGSCRGGYSRETGGGNAQTSKAL